MGRPSAPYLRGNLVPALGWIVLIVSAAVVPYTVAQLTSGDGGSAPLAVPAVEPSAAPSTVTASPAAGTASLSPSTVTATPLSAASTPAAVTTAGPAAGAIAGSAAGPGITGSSNGDGAVPASPGAPSYVVKPGDSIWLITAHTLGASANINTIQSTWPKIYAANRAVIGANPNIVRPGELLTLTN